MKILLVSIICLVLSACATYQPPKKYNVETQKVINKPYDIVWNTLIKWFAENGTSIKNMDKGAGFIATDYGLSVGTRSSYCDCGQMGFGESVTNQTGNFNVIIEKKGDDSTNVILNVFFKAIFRVMGNQYTTAQAVPIDCNSKGVLEKDIFNFISK